MAYAVCRGCVCACIPFTYHVSIITDCLVNCDHSLSLSELGLMGIGLVGSGPIYSMAGKLLQRPKSTQNSRSRVTLTIIMFVS